MLTGQSLSSIHYIRVNERITSGLIRLPCTEPACWGSHLLPPIETRSNQSAKHWLKQDNLHIQQKNNSCETLRMMDEEEEAHLLSLDESLDADLVTLKELNKRCLSPTAYNSDADDNQIGTDDASQQVEGSDSSITTITNSQEQRQCDPVATRNDEVEEDSKELRQVKKGIATITKPEEAQQQQLNLIDDHIPFGKSKESPVPTANIRTFQRRIQDMPGHPRFHKDRASHKAAVPQSKENSQKSTKRKYQRHSQVSHILPPPMPIWILPPPMPIWVAPGAIQNPFANVGSFPVTLTFQVNLFVPSNAPSQYGRDPFFLQPPPQLPAKRQFSTYELPAGLTFRVICQRCGRKKDEHHASHLRNGGTAFGVNKCDMPSCAKCHRSENMHRGSPMGFYCVLANPLQEFEYRQRLNAISANKKPKLNR